MGLKEILICPSDEDINLMQKFKEVPTVSLSHKKCISINTLIDLHREGYFASIPLHEKLEQSQLCFQSHPVAPRDQELDERVKKLKAEQDNQEYRAMTKHLYPPDQQNLSFQTDVRSVSAQLIAVINFALTVGGTFFFTYKAVEYALPVENIPAQVMMGIVTSTVVALADLFFLARTI